MALLVLPEVVTWKLGLNARLAQLEAWNGSLTATVTSSAGLMKFCPDPMMLAPSVRGLQLVGFIVKLARSM